MCIKSPPIRRHRLFALLAALLLIAAACGSSPANDNAASDGIASISSDTTSGAGGSDITAADETGAESGVLEAPENPEDAFALFGDCMTEHGFDFGDALTTTVGGGGGAVIEVDPGDLDSEVDPQAPVLSLEDFDAGAFEDANKECEGHLVNVDQFADFSPEERAAFEDAQLKFADCMAEQGIEIPDFDGATGGIIIESGPDRGRPTNRSALIR